MAIKGELVPESGKTGGILSEEEKNYCQVFNSKWRVLSKPLALQIK